MNGMFISKSPDRYSSGKEESDTAGLGRFKESENTRLEQEDKKYQPVRPRTHADSAAVDKLTSTLGERKGFAKGTITPAEKTAMKHPNVFGAGAAKRRKLKSKKSKFATVMREGYKGTLHSGGSGKIVTNPAQMKAIAASEAGMSRKGNADGTVRTMPAPSGIRFTPKG